MPHESEDHGNAAERFMPADRYDELPKAGFVREKTLLAPYGPLPIDRSTLWRWVKDGRFPKPIKIGPNTTAWRAEDVRRFLSEPGASNA